MDQNISHAGQSGAQSRNDFLLSFRQLVASHLPSGFMSEPNTHEQLEYAFKTLSEGAPLLADFEAEVQEHSILSFADELSGLLFSHLSDYFHNLNVDQSDLIVFPMPVSTMVNSVLKGNTDASALVGGAHTLPEEVRSLIGTMLLRPIRQAVRIAFEHDHPSHEWRLGYCPVCGLWAPMGRIEPEHGRRLLWCIGCNGQWRFPRVCCHLCYESDQKKLGYLSVEEWPAWRLYTCETCHRSLKTRDERHADCAGATEMDIDYVDSGILDDVASRDGYKPVKPGEPVFRVPFDETARKYIERSRSI